MARTSGALRRGAVVVFFTFMLAACGSEDSTTAAEASGDDGAEAVSTTITTTTTTSTTVEGAMADESDDDHADESDDDHADDADEEHADEEHDEDKHDDHDDDSSGGLGAHQHGVADLSVAWSEGEVIVDLISPTENIFGFEYEPSTDDDRALVADRTEALSKPGLIAINDEAGCDLTEDVAVEVEYEGSHAELTASWLFSCEQPDEINQLDVAGLFTEFPGIEDIDAQWVSPSDQSAAELSPSATVLDLN